VNCIEQAIRDFIVHEIQLAPGTAQPVAEDDNFVESGLIDSFRFLELIVSLEKKFSVELDFSNLDPAQFSTIGGLVHHCHRLIQEQANST
jgi:acyl carrier protein